MPEHRVATRGGERLVASRRLDEAPVQVARVAHDVIRPLTPRVAGMAEALDARDGPCPSAQVWLRPGPDADAADVRPPERAEEDRGSRVGREREHDVFEMYAGSSLAPELLKKYHVSYVLIEFDRVRDFHENLAQLLQRYPAVYQGSNYVLLQVR